MLNRVQLKNAFNEIDTDGSGAIDIGELANLCGKVNVTDVDQTNVGELFKEIDTNHDGKISFEEFTAWYRLGRNSKLRDVLKYQLKALNKLDAHFTKKYKKAGAYDSEGRTTAFDVEIRDGEPDEGNTDCCLRFTTKADEELSDRVGRACPDLTVRLGEGHDSELPAGTRAFPCFTMRSSNPEALAQALRDFYNSAKDMLMEMEPSMEGVFDAVKYHVGTDEDWVVIASDALGNPFVEEFIIIFQNDIKGMVDMALPEVVWRTTTDATWESVRTAEDMLNMVDNSRLKFEFSMDTVGKKELMNLFESMFPADLEASQGLNVWRLWNGFKFRVKANSKDQAGGLNQNFQKMLQAMEQVDHPGMDDLQIMLAGHTMPYKTWGECMLAVKDNSDSQPVAELKNQMNTYPFVKDFLNAVRTHGVADMNTSIFVNNNQLSCESRTKGFGQCFSEVWEALGL